jgi:uncharacterized protein (TIGR02001 family)
MKKLVLAVAMAAAVTSSAFAADMPVKAAKIAAAPSPWDIAFGSALMNDYIFRGITQSNRKPSVAAYFEPRYNINKNLQLYAGIAGESISFANRAAAEIDFYAGIRPTVGPVAFDFGYWYYYYPGGQCFSGTPGCNPALPNGNVIKSVNDFWEVYAKATWTVIDPLALGVNYYYSPNFLNLGATGSYLSGTAKYTLPTTFAGGIGMYVSGELGRQWLGTSNPFYGTAAFPGGVKYKDYTTWNVGVGFTYKVFTLDLRYSDTNLSKGDCNAFTSDPGAGGVGNVTAINPGGAGSRWCGPAFIAKLAADLTLDSLK